jgi:hypothetical protein
MPRSTKKKSASNAGGDPTQSLQSFNLLDLRQYTLEKSYSPSASQDFHLFYVGRDDVHDILKYVLSRVGVSLYLNMFGYDDDELNDILMAKAMDPNITVMITLDKSQASGKTEKALLDADQKKNLSAFNTNFVIGQSLTHQISHTQRFCRRRTRRRRRIDQLVNIGRRHIRSGRRTGRNRLQGAEQHAVDFHRPGYSDPLSGGADCRAHDRAEAGGPVSAESSCE